MGELKEHQPPMTIDEQIENLKNTNGIMQVTKFVQTVETANVIFVQFLTKTEIQFAEVTSKEVKKKEHLCTVR